MNIRLSDGRWIDFSNACWNVPNAWTVTSYSYSVCRDVNTHSRIERCVMCRSSFRNFPSFLDARAHSAHNTWATLWSVRSFSSKTQSSFILSTITEEWKFSYRIFTYIQNETFFLNVSLKTHSQFKVYVPKVTKSFIFFYQKYLSQNNRHREIESVYTVPKGWNLDLNRCTCNDKTLSANWQVGDNRNI